MNYPFTRADWFAKALPKTRLYRKVRTGILTLGHLRTAEALEIGFFVGLETSPLDWGILISLSQMHWKKGLKKASKPGFFWALRRDRNRPRNVEEYKACIEWWKSQNYYPSRMHIKAEEKAHIEELNQLAVNRASSSVERLALSVTKIQGWQSLTGYDCIWDVPMITATHLLVAHSELDGIYHIPYDLIRMAKNGTSTT